MPVIPSVEPIDSVSNNLCEILYHLHYTLKLDAKGESKKILTKARLALRDLERMKNNTTMIRLKGVNFNG